MTWHRLCHTKAVSLGTKAAAARALMPVILAEGAQWLSLLTAVPEGLSRAQQVDMLLVLSLHKIALQWFVQVWCVSF